MADKENRITLAHLAIALVRDNPRASDLELVHRWVARVQSDEDLLNGCLQQGANHAIAMARDFIARERRARKRRELLSKTVAEARGQVKALLGDERFKRLVDQIGGKTDGRKFK